MLSRLSAVRCLPRTSAVRHLPRAISLRYLTDGRTEGSVAQSQGFNKREKALENQYAQQHEKELLRKLKADIEAKKAELDLLELEKKKVEEGGKE